MIKPYVKTEITQYNVVHFVYSNGTQETTTLTSVQYKRLKQTKRWRREIISAKILQQTSIAVRVKIFPQALEIKIKNNVV